MKYRIYVDGTRDYYDLGTYEVDETIFYLDWLILDEQTKKDTRNRMQYRRQYRVSSFLIFGKTGRL